MIRDQNSIHASGTLAERCLHISVLSVPPRRNRIERGREEERKNSFLWTSMEEKEERDYSRKPVPPGPQDQFQNYGQAHSIAPPTFSSGQVHRTPKDMWDRYLKDRHPWSLD